MNSENGDGSHSSLNSGMEDHDTLLATEKPLRDERQQLFNQIKRQHRLVIALAHDDTITRSMINGIANRILEIEETLVDPGRTSIAIFQKIREINKQLLADEEVKERQVAQRQSLANQVSTSSTQPLPPTMSLNVSSLDPHVSISPWNGTALGYYRFSKQFTSFYINDPSYTDVKRLNAFRKLVGDKGRQVIGDIDDDHNGLILAMKRMSDYFCQAHHIRGEVERQLINYPTIRSERDAFGLKQFLSIAENAYKALQFSNTSREYLADTFYGHLKRKLPWSMMNQMHIDFGDTRDVKTLLDRVREQVSRSESINEAQRDNTAVAAPTRTRIHHVASDPYSNQPINNRVTRSSTNSRYSNPRSQTPIHLRNPAAVPPLTNSYAPPSVNRSLNIRCRLCDQHGHHIFQCSYGTYTDRAQLATRKQLCTRCLNYHPNTQCRSTYICPCGGQHSRILCNDNGTRPMMTQSTIRQQQQRPTQSNASNSTQTSNTGPSATINMAIPNVGPNQPITQSHGKKYARPELLTTYLQTVVVTINGERVRVLLDSAAGRTLILESLVNRLKLPDYARHNLNLGAFDGSSNQTSRRLVKATLQSINTRRSKEIIMCVTPKIDTLPPVVPPEIWNDLQDRGYELSDPLENNHQPIGIILGAEYYREVFTGNDIEYSNELSIRHSIFGWTITGVTEDTDEDYDQRLAASTHSKRPLTIGLINCTNVSCHHITTEDLINTTNLMAETEKPFGNSMDYSSPYQPDSATKKDKFEDQYLRDFISTHVHYDGKRYSVNLPWILPLDMEDNKMVALTRYHRLQRSLTIRSLTTLYDEALNDMARDYTEQVSEHCVTPKCYYLPHHPVVKLDRETTKLRVVFDGSSHSSTSKPLNDFLYKGVVKWDLLTVLLKFRFGEYAITADIEKAFLRIGVEPDDRDAFRFWWKDNQGRTIIRRFTAVPFGTSTSPFLLFAVLTHLFYSNRTAFNDIISIIEKRMYVDDIIVSFPTGTSASQLEHFRSRSVELFQKADMNLRKFRTNHRELDANWNGADAKDDVHSLGHDWNVKNDTFGPWIDINRFLSSVTLTKRQFTSFVQSVYNPTGIVAPFILKLKFALQALWKMKLKWDEPIPENEYKQAMALIKESTLVNQMTSPRNVLPTDDTLPVLRIYCDASKLALGVVAYSCSSLGNILLFAKTRLARDATIPELELDSLLMAAELSHYLSTVVYPFTRIIICGDSKLNLQRLLKHPNKQTPPVALRVRAITRLAPTATFRHVESKDNLADLVSRGTTMTALLANKSWLKAPDLSESTQFESQITSVISTFTPTTPDFKCPCTPFPSYGRAINSYLYVARFMHRFGRQEQYKELHELELALVLLIRNVQQNHFLSEIELLATGQPIPRESILNNFTVYLDNLSQLRLRTRLKESHNFSLDDVHPIILPNHCHFSRLIIRHVHSMVLHPGVDRTLSTIRERYFIINSHKLVKKFVNNCTICKLKRSQQVQLSHGQLPSFRTDIYHPPFYNTGIDLFGPLKVLMTTPGKRYGVIFVCATSRMVHIELVNDMTAETVFDAITKFVARRGLPHLFYSDNGKQFLKIKDDLKEYIDLINRKHPERELRFNWIHLTAHSPWRGGFYERLIRGIKESLITLALDRKMNTKRLTKERDATRKQTTVTGGKPITDKQLETYMIEIEALINNRPLFAHEGQVIRPTDFLGAQGSSQLPIVGNLPTDYRKPNIIDDYRKAQRRINTVRKLWRDNYFLRLRELHQTQTGKHDRRKYEVGDVVHVKKPTTPLDQWPLGIVTNVFVSKDGVIRSVTLRTINHGSVVTEVKDVHNLIPVECNHERHETADTPAETQAHIVQTRSTIRNPTPTITAAKTTLPKKVATATLIKRWKQRTLKEQQEADYRQSIRDRISSSIRDGSPKTSKQIKDWLKELYSLSTDSRCRLLATTRSTPTSDAEGSSQASTSGVDTLSRCSAATPSLCLAGMD
ncbi:hypothetical protein TYRP_015466 [Tyrophagus putrescentiae]|nr:hypothetical protein TYRP_015466 [Tyrophagus putrescentiae]